MEKKGVLEGRSGLFRVMNRKREKSPDKPVVAVGPAMGNYSRTQGTVTRVLFKAMGTGKPWKVRPSK